MTIANSNSHDTKCIVGNGMITVYRARQKAYLLLNLAYRINILGCAVQNGNAKFTLSECCNGDSLR